MVDQTNKYERNFEQQGQLKRPGRIDLRIFQYLANCGDGYPGLQYAIHKLLGESLFPRFVIEGCVYDGSSTLSAGYIMYAGKVVKVSQQTWLTVNNSEFLYINSAGNAQITAVEATAKANVMIYARDSGGVGKTVIFSYQDNELYIYDAVIRHNLDIDGTLDVAGVADFHENVDMNANQVKAVADPTAAQDAVTRTYLRNFMPVGTILMYKGVGWVNNVSMVGWYKCDGDNGTPDLVNKFIRSEASSGNEGGSDDAVVVQHNHGGSVADGGVHTHNLKVSDSTPPIAGVLDIGTGTFAWKFAETESSGNHDHAISNDGVSGVDANKPAYYSLIFIMRIS